MHRLFLTVGLLIPVMAHGGSPFKSIVAADGSGDFTSVQAAVDAAPSGLSEAWPILVKAGDYNELISIPADKPFIHLIGQDPANTVIHYMINQGGKPEEHVRYDKTTYWKWSFRNPESDNFGKGPAAVMIHAPGFYAEDISFVNDWGAESTSGPQALAMHSDADRVALSGCVLRSFQDTWRTPNDDSCRNYARDCRIEGAVDYMYGGGDVFVENSTFYNLRSGSVIVAPSHGPDTRWGYVIRDCVIDGNAQSADGRQKLGRPWQGAPKTVFINTLTFIPVTPQGWDNMGVIPAIFADYNTRDREGNTPDMSLRKSVYKTRAKGDRPVYEASCCNSITPEEAATYTYDNVIRPSEGWDPRAISAKLPAPEGLKLENGRLSWLPVEGAAGYIVFDGDRIVATATDTEIAIPEVRNSLKVKAVNRFGAKGLPAQ